MSNAFVHIPVLYNEALDGLNINPSGIYVDGTLGGGGHSKGIAQRLSTGRLIVNDLDNDAIAAAQANLKQYEDKITYIHDDYKNILTHLDRLNIDKVDGILLDLGVSSYQIDTAERGFSYMKDAPLDMRMDKDGEGTTAWDIVNEYSIQQLTRIFVEYGEERFARKIANDIAKARAIKPIDTTLQLANLIANGCPVGFKFGHPAKKVFQALRIEVNGELSGLYQAVEGMARRLKTGGRMCVITFHSLEDRIIKTCFKYLEQDCICDKNMPVCVCGKVSEVALVNKKPIEASASELADNKRAESAKLRIIQKK